MTVVAISRPTRQAFCNVSAFCWSRLAPARATFLPGFGRNLSDARRLLGYSLSNTAGLFGSPLGGATGCVLNALCRLFPPGVGLPSLFSVDFC